MSKVERLMLTVQPDVRKVFIAAVLEAALIYQTGGDWKAYMRRFKNKYTAGAASKLFSTIYNYSTKDMEGLAGGIAKERS